MAAKCATNAISELAWKLAFAPPAATSALTLPSSNFTHISFPQGKRGRTKEKSSSFKDCEQFLWKISTICIDAPCQPASPPRWMMFSDFDDFSFGILFFFYFFSPLLSIFATTMRVCFISRFPAGEENLIFLNLLKRRACVYEWIIWIKIYSAIKARKCFTEPVLFTSSSEQKYLSLWLPAP